MATPGLIQQIKHNSGNNNNHGRGTLNIKEMVDTKNTKGTNYEESCIRMVVTIDDKNIRVSSKKPIFQ